MGFAFLPRHLGSFRVPMGGSSGASWRSLGASRGRPGGILGRLGHFAGPPLGRPWEPWGP
eukprot:9488637-Pyramimonas_sp.AAC.1